jgi:hypothetical protein
MEATVLEAMHQGLGIISVGYRIARPCMLTGLTELSPTTLLSRVLLPYYMRVLDQAEDRLCCEVGLVRQLYAVLPLW